MKRKLDLEHRTVLQQPAQQQIIYATFKAPTKPNVRAVANISRRQRPRSMPLAIAPATAASRTDISKPGITMLLTHNREYWSIVVVVVCE